MALIEIPENPEVTPLTTEEAKTAELFLVKTTINTLLIAFSKNFTTVFESIWANKNGLTPQECFDALGTDAATLLYLAGSLQNAVNTLAPGTINITTPEGFQLVPNQDGTVTVVHL
jgi:hypothetical protein